MTPSAGYSMQNQGTSGSDASVGGGIGTQNFNFGGNPNLAQLAQSKMWPLVFGAVAVAVILWTFKRK
jgi:hypothetical protein